jgi:hypothetical protein
VKDKKKHFDVIDDFEVAVLRNTWIALERKHIELFSQRKSLQK